MTSWPSLKYKQARMHAQAHTLLPKKTEKGGGASAWTKTYILWLCSVLWLTDISEEENELHNRINVDKLTSLLQPEWQPPIVPLVWETSAGACSVGHIIAKRFTTFLIGQLQIVHPHFKTFTLTEHDPAGHFFSSSVFTVLRALSMEGVALATTRA